MSTSQQDKNYQVKNLQREEIDTMIQIAMMMTLQELVTVQPPKMR